MEYKHLKLGFCVVAFVVVVKWFVQVYLNVKCDLSCGTLSLLANHLLQDNHRTWKAGSALLC